MICIAGAIQFGLARLKVARLSAIFPAAAIEGMLAAIGLMIIVKQAPLLLGQKFQAHEFWEIVREIPEKFAVMNPQVFFLGIGCIVLIFVLAAIPSRLLKVMPPPVWAFGLGHACGHAVPEPESGEPHQRARGSAWPTASCSLIS